MISTLYFYELIVKPYGHAHSSEQCQPYWADSE